MKVRGCLGPSVCGSLIGWKGLAGLPSNLEGMFGMVQLWGVILHHTHHIYHSSHQAPSNSTSEVCLPSAIFLLLPRQMHPLAHSSTWSDSCLPKSLPLTPVRGTFYKGINQIMSPPVGKGSPASHCPLGTIYPQPEGPA